MIWPDLIISKIYWYLWKHNIQLVNQYYVLRYKMSLFSPAIIYDNYKKCYINYRRLYKNCLAPHIYTFLYTKNIYNTNIPLPKNYIFSSGLNSSYSYK